eukprot:1686883-Amphidinium_carterae.1
MDFMLLCGRLLVTASTCALPSFGCFLRASHLCRVCLVRATPLLCRAGGFHLLRAVAVQVRSIMQTIYAKPALWPDALPAGCEASHSNFVCLVHLGESWCLLHAGTGERIAVNHMGSPTLVFQGGL